MPPKGLAILIGAGPTSGIGIARMLAHPQHGNLAVALLARDPDRLSELASTLRSQIPGGGAVIEAFATDTSTASLEAAFASIRAHPSFASLALRLSIFHIKHSSRKPFLSETPAEFAASVDTYTTGAYVFARESLARMYADAGGETPLSPGRPRKKGTIIFTGTLGALRANEQFAAYGATRAGVRMVAQALAKEVSRNGVHVVHTIANGGITDEIGPETESGKKMSAEAVGKTYLWLSEQEPTLWVHELDMRPAQEKF